MADVIQFATRAQIEREAMVAQARANYESIFPTTPATPEDTAPCEYVAPAWDPA